MLSRLPWTPRPEIRIKVKPRRLDKNKRRHLVDTVATIIKAGREDGQPSHFWCEAACRHGLRSSLCLSGWSWAEADTIAADIVATALNTVGARRPTWLQGQPEYCQLGAAVYARSRCLNCGWKLPEGHFRFCDKRCAKSFHHSIDDVDRKKREAARAALYRAAQRERAKPIPCERCGNPFKPDRPGRRFCSRVCSGSRPVAGNHIWKCT